MGLGAALLRGLLSKGVVVVGDRRKGKGADVTVVRPDKEEAVKKKKEMDKEMTRYQKMDKGMTAGFGWRRKAKIQWVTAKEEEEEVGPLVKNMRVWEMERQKKQEAR